MHSHHTIHRVTKKIKNERGVRVHPDKNHVMLTRPPPPRVAITWDASEGWMYIYSDPQHPFFSLSRVWNKVCHCFLQQHEWHKSTGWVFSAWKEGCVIYRRLWQNCPEWVLSLGTTTVNSTDTPRDPHNYTLLIPIAAIFSHSTHSTACSLTANYRTSPK